MSVATLRIVLAALFVVWAATAVMDGRRLAEGYVLAASFEGEAPISQAIEFTAVHKVVVATLSIGIIVGVALAVFKRSLGFSVAAISVAATLAVGIWSVREYGLLGAPFSTAQFAALLAILFASFSGHQRTKAQKRPGNAT